MIGDDLVSRRRGSVAVPEVRFQWSVCKETSRHEGVRCLVLLVVLCMCYVELQVRKQDASD